MAGVKLLLDTLVFLDLGYIVDVDGFALIGSHETHSIFDMTESAMAEDVIFMKAEVLCVIHIEVCDRKSLGHHLQCCVIREWAFRYKYSTGMDREIVGEALDHLAVAEDVACVRMMFFIGEWCIDDRIDIGFGEADDFAEFADDGTTFESVVRRQ